VRKRVRAHRFQKDTFTTQRGAGFGYIQQQGWRLASEGRDKHLLALSRRGAAGHGATGRPRAGAGPSTRPVYCKWVQSFTHKHTQTNVDAHKTATATAGRSQAAVSV
jgi:hypothetical protein